MKLSLRPSLGMKEAQGSQVCSQCRFLGHVQTPFVGLSTKVLNHLGSQSSQGAQVVFPPHLTPSQAQLRASWFQLSSPPSFPLWSPSDSAGRPERHTLELPTFLSPALLF